MRKQLKAWHILLLIAVFAAVLMLPGCGSKEVSTPDPEETVEVGTTETDTADSEESSEPDQTEEDSEPSEGLPPDSEEPTETEDQIDSDTQPESESQQESQTTQFGWSDVQFVSYEDLDPVLFDPGNLDYDGTIPDYLTSGDYLLSPYTTAFRDGDLMLALVHLDAATSHDYDLLCRSLDGGQTWDYMSSLFEVIGGTDDVTIADGYFAMTSGAAVYDGSCLTVYRENCTQVCVIEASDLALEGIGGDSGIYARIREIDGDNGTILLDWHSLADRYGESESDEVLASTEINLDKNTITQIAAD